MMFTKKDPLDSLLERELSGKSILQDEWEDALEDFLAEDLPTLQEQLRQAGMTRTEALDQLEALRQELYALAEETGLPITNRFAFCQGLHDLPTYTEQSIRLLCLLLSDTNVLLFPESVEGEEQALEEYLLVQERLQEQTQFLYSRKTLQLRWKTLLQELLRDERQAVTAPPLSVHPLFLLCCELFPAAETNDILLHNLNSLLARIGESKALRSVAPLYLYQMLVKHNSRLRKNRDLHSKPQSLWRYTAYRIDEDNGKNFHDNNLRLELFRRLCALFAEDPLVDMTLCGWGFASLSNLEKFYGCGFYIEEIPHLPQPLDTWLVEQGFTCFPHGLGDAVVFTKSGLIPDRLERFQSDPRRSFALERISAYMSKRALILTERFLESTPAQIRQLCVDILTGSKLSSRHAPKSTGEVMCFLAAIESGLMELTDSFAIQLLAEGLERFIRETTAGLTK